MPIPKLLITAGLMIAQMALTMTRTIEGPRLDDLKGTTAGYGTPHPNGLGLTKTAAPCFYCEPIKEKKKKRKTKGGKYKEYTYFGTWAAMVAGHEIQRVRRIWFDKHLVYDVTGGGGPTSIGEDGDTVENLTGNNTALTDLMRIYLGTETQEPDPRMLATVEENEGPGTCPAYKGIAYIFFEDVPLEKLGNRFPQIDVEFDGIGTEGLSFTTITDFVSDPDYDYFYPFSHSPNGRYIFSGLFQAFNTLDLSTTTVNTAFDPLADNYYGLNIDDDGTVYGLLSNTGDLYRFGNFAHDAPVYLASASDLSVIGGMRLFHVGGQTKLVWPAQTIPLRGVVIYDVDTDTITELANPGGGIWLPWLIVQDMYGDVWAVGHTQATPTEIHFWRVINNGSGSAAADHVILAGLAGDGVKEVVFTPSGVFISNGLGEHLYLLDEDDFSVLLHRAYGAGPLAYEDSNLRNFLMGVPPGSTEFWYLGPNSTGSPFSYIDVHKIRASDLTTIDSHDLTDWAAGDNLLGETLTYSPYTDVLVSTDSLSDGIVLRYFTGGQTLSLGTIIRHFSGLVGHVEGTDYTIHASVDAIEVDGLLWTQGQAKQGFDWLIDIYDVIARPHDGVTQFIARGVASSFSLTTPEFVIERGQPENRYKLTVSNDTDMPAQVTFNFADTGNDLEPNNVSSGRDEQATDATGKLTIDGTTLTLGADNAQQMVDRYFRSKWFRRARSENRVSTSRLAIEPGDVGTIDFDGLTLKLEVEKAKHSADGSIHLECLQYDQALAALSGGVGSPAMGRPASEIFSPGDSVGFVLDLPLLTDAHDQAAPFLYVAGGPEDPDTQYIGTDFSQSDTGDPDTFEPGWAGTGSSDPATYGTVATPIDASEPWNIDNASVIDVVLVDGTLSSVTEDQMLNNASLNLFAYGAPGRWMLGQFKTATLTAPLTYDVSGLILGAKGTEQHIGTQIAGDRFILLDNAVATRTVGADEIGDTDWYIPAAPGSTPDAADEIELEFAAAAHRPLSPVHGTLTLSGSDWEIDAVRRTRIGGSTVNGQDVPLGETSESWEADIYDGLTFKRVITGTSLPLTYTAAQQTTDFGAPVTTGFEVNLYQMSPALLIRGFPLALAA